MHTTDNTALTPENQILLKTLGLTPTAAKCYLWLVDEQHGRKAHYIAKALALRNTSVYRALHELTLKGYVSRLQIAPTPSYRAIPITDALDNYADYQRQLAKPLIRQQRRREADAV